MSTRLPKGSPRAAYFAQGLPDHATATGCLEWQGARHDQGYGRCWDADRQAVVYAHRLAYELAHGVTLPPEVKVRHACDHPPCVNEAHLLAGDQAANMRDRTERGRMPPPPRGEAHAQAKLTEEEVRAIRVQAAAGATQQTLAECHGVSQPCILAILKRRTWAHVR